MLSFKHADARDLSGELIDVREWQIKDFRRLDTLLDASAFAYDPTSGLLAIGTDSGAIRILGGPAVDVKLENGSAVKSLHFAASSFRLVCTDASERLRVWDLGNPDSRHTPPLVASTSVNAPISAVYASPLYSHVLVVLLSGEVRAYDIVDAAWAPRPVPNIWAVYEEKMLSSGALTEKRANSQQGMTVIAHPRDLACIFVAYEGGVTLYDLETRKLVRAYELVLPPGAPGGAGYSQPDLMLSRYPPVTSIAVHPSGHIIAVGHLNGEITFWATEDEDKPVACITLDEDDVNMVNGEKLAAGPHGPSIDREPIFKIVWSGYSNSDDPRGGTTTLAIVGGRNDGLQGVTVFHLPAFNPPEPPANTSMHESVHPVFRAAMRATVTPSDTYLYTTHTPVIDILLLPRDNPHFGSSFDPESILLLTEGHGGTKSLEARSFPPPQFNPTFNQATPTPAPSDHDTNDVEADLAATLAALTVVEEPAELELPPVLWSGKNAPEQPILVKLERDAHTKLTSGRKTTNSWRLDGGQAWAEETPDTRLIKFAPHRVIVSRHRDMTVKIQDMDPQLLVGSPEEPLASSFPRLASDLIIDLLEVLADSAVAAHFPPSMLQGVDIASVQLSSQTLDVVVALTTGEVILYQLDSSARDYWDSQDGEIVCVQHVSGHPERRFHPSLMLKSLHGAVTSFAISDIRLLAVAYEDGAILICDIHRHTVIIRDSLEKQQRKSLFHRSSDGMSKVLNLSWTVCGIKKDSHPRVRLVVVTSNGDGRIYTLDRRDRSSPWTAILSGDLDGIPSAFSDPETSVVIEANTGFRCKADNHGLMTSMDPDHVASKRGDKHWVWVIAGAKGARANLDVNGDRLGKVDFKVGNAVACRMVERTDSSVLVTFTERCQVLVYSLPGLELMHTLDLPFSGKVTPLISADTTGDYLLSTLHPSAHMIQNIAYGSLFSQRRSYYKLPLVDLGAKRKPVPPAPVPVSMGPANLMSTLVGLVSGPRVLMGEDIDVILSGKERVPKPTTSQRGGGLVSSLAKPGQAPVGAYNIPDVNAMGQQLGQGASQVGQQIGQGATAIFGQVQSALSERGEMLDSLQASMRNLQEGSQNALNQARLAAAKQGAKGWFGSLM